MTAQPTHGDLPNAAFSAAMDELFRPALRPPLAVAKCDGCGRDDTYLTESIAGTLACIDCIGDAAYDAEGDRR